MKKIVVLLPDQVLAENIIKYFAAGREQWLPFYKQSNC
jgi:hypothetical protein